jgi:hypothetical protein
MTESCRLITEEQYKEWKDSEKKLEIATKALKDIVQAFNMPSRYDMFRKCQQALKEMEEV